MTNQMLFLEIFSVMKILALPKLMCSDVPLWFWFAFLWWVVMLNIFSYTWGIFVCCFWTNIYSNTLFFIFLLLSCRSFLYIIDIRSLSNTWFAYVLLFCRLPFHSVSSFISCFINCTKGFFFVFFLVWCSLTCLFLPFLLVFFYVISRKSLLRLMSRNFLCDFSFRRFTACI